MLARRIVVAIALAFLLPLVVYQGVTVICKVPQPFNAAVYDQRIAATKSLAEKQKISADRKAAQAANEAASKAAGERMQQMLFYIGFPIGLLAFLIGGLLETGWAGIGLMYGGIATLAGSTADYWAKMDTTLRLEALGIAFLVVLIYGLIKVRPGLRPSGPGPLPTA